MFEKKKLYDTSRIFGFNGGPCWTFRIYGVEVEISAWLKPLSLQVQAEDYNFSTKAWATSPILQDSVLILASSQNPKLPLAVSSGQASTALL